MGKNNFQSLIFNYNSYLCDMQRIFTHIERLLLTNDCVIIPEFGGFVLHPCPATYQPKEHRFCPPGKNLVFNPTLKHYDKLIPESYIQKYGMTFEEAHLSLRKDIEELYQILDKEGSVYFEKTGFLRKDDTGKLFFEVERNPSFVGLKPYGLHPFYLSPVVNETPAIIKLETKQKHTDSAPINQAFLRIAGVSAAAVALFLLISTPVNDGGNSSYSASLIPSEIIPRNICVSGIHNDTIQESVVEVEMVKHTAASEEIPIPEVVQEPQPTTKAVEAIPQRTYYAIIGSFTSERQANQFIQQINMPELSNMGIVKYEEKVRVYADKFDNRNDAQNYILRLRANIKLKDTWLFVEQ